MFWSCSVKLVASLSIPSCYHCGKFGKQLRNFVVLLLLAIREPIHVDSKVFLNFAHSLPLPDTIYLPKKAEGNTGPKREEEAFCKSGLRSE